MPGITKLDVTANRILEDGRHRLGFNDAQVQGLLPHIDRANLIFQAHDLKVGKIRQDRDISSEGKAKRIDVLKAETLQHVAAFRQQNDKAEMIQDHKVRQDAMVKKVRSISRPEDSVVAYHEAKELRDHFRQMSLNYADRLKAGGLTVDEKQAGNPVDNLVLQSAASYSIEKGANNREHEAVLSALIDGPAILSPLSQELKEKVAQTLRETLAPVETEHLRVAVGYHALLGKLADSLESMVGEA